MGPGNEEMQRIPDHQMFPDNQDNSTGALHHSLYDDLVRTDAVEIFNAETRHLRSDRELKDLGHSNKSIPETRDA